MSDTVNMEARRLEPDVIACHEAGHAVACVVLNVTLCKRQTATIVPDGDRLGMVRHHRDPDGRKGRSLATVCLCGPMAEDLYVGCFDGSLCSGDDESFDAHTGDILRGWGHPSRIKSHARYSELRWAEWTVAKILVLEHWDAVKWIAAALLEKKTLDRDDVLDLYHEATQPQPKLPLDWTADVKAVDDLHFTEWQDWYAARFGKQGVSA
jgi:hypothetical protein